LLAEARERVEQPGEYLVYEESDEWRTVALTREWTRIGRSLAADVRFDDRQSRAGMPLIVRQPDGVRSARRSQPERRVRERREDRGADAQGRR